MKILNVIRSQEWWDHKIPPLLAIGYATVLQSSTPIYQTALWMIILLLALVTGAIYVSVINDITDLDEDLRSGKANRIQKVPAHLRWLIPATCLLFGAGFTYLLYPDTLSCLLYLLPWIVFSLYSIRPARLKNRGIWGVIADACGSHVFTSLFMISSLSYLTHQNIHWTWFFGVGLWAFCYGLRGILWHQFSDRENDIKVQLNTFASRLDPISFGKWEKLLYFLEICALIVILNQIHLIAPVIALVCYAVLVQVRRKMYQNRIILILQKNGYSFQILMSDYYPLFLPLSLLIYSATIDYKNLIVLVAHILLFPYKLKFALYDYLKFFRSFLFKIFKKKE
jgi:1,4-dihydroxy-2-naphthoate octaprenyltransferase